MESSVFKPRASQLILSDGDVNKQNVRQTVGEAAMVKIIKARTTAPANGRETVDECIKI